MRIGWSNLFTSFLTSSQQLKTSYRSRYGMVSFRRRWVFSFGLLLTSVTFFLVLSLKLEAAEGSTNASPDGLIDFEYQSSLLWSQIWDLQIQGDYAYCALEMGFMVLDLRDISNPQVAAQLYLPDIAWHPSIAVKEASVFVKGNIAYFVNESAGFYIIDITEPSNPTVMGSLQIEHPQSGLLSLGNGVTVSNGVAYFSNGDFLPMHRVDVSDPLAPVEITDEFGGCAIGSEPLLLSIRNDILLRVSYLGVSMADVSTSPAQCLSYVEWPQQVDYRRMNMHPERGEMVVARDHELTLLDFTSNALTIVNQFFDSTQTLRDVVLYQDVAYIAADSSLLVTDVHSSNEDFIVLNSLLAPTNMITGLNVSGSILSLYSLEGVVFYDLTNPLEPVELGRYLPGGLIGVVQNGDFAFASTTTDRVFSINIASPTSPLVAGECQIAGTALDVELYGGYLYLALDDGTFTSVSISDPNNHYVVEQYPLFSTCLSFEIDNNLAYAVTDDSQLVIVSLADPSNMFILGSVTLPSLPRAICKDVYYAYVDCSDQFIVVDVNDYYHPNIISQLAYPELKRSAWTYGHEIAFQNERCYIAPAFIIDVSNREAPAIVTNEDFWDRRFQNVEIFDNRLFWTAGWGLSFGPLISRMDIGQPDYPISDGLARTPGWGFWSGDVAVVGDLAYYVNGQAFWVLQMVPRYDSPYLDVSQTAMRFVSPYPGIDSDPQHLRLRNGGPGSIFWTAEAGDSWVSVGPSNGYGNDQLLEISIQDPGFPVGTYTSSIVIASDEAENSPLSVSIEYSVRNDPPALQLNIWTLDDEFWAFLQMPQEITTALRLTQTGEYIPGSSGAVVEATFSNGEPPLLLTDADDDGYYTVTWTPSTLGPVEITLTAAVESYTPVEKVVAGGVYVPVDASSLQESVDRLKLALQGYLQNNPLLVGQVLEEAIDHLLEDQDSQIYKYASKLVQSLAKTTVQSEIEAVLRGKFPGEHLATFAIKFIFETSLINQGQQLQSVKETIVDPISHPFDPFAFEMSYPIPGHDITPMAASDQLPTVAVPAYVPEGYPLAVQTEMIEALTSSLEQATTEEWFLSHVHDYRSSMSYWLAPSQVGSTDDIAAVHIGSELSRAQQFADDWESLQNTSGMHKGISFTCDIGSWGTTLFTIASGGTAAPGAAIFSSVCAASDIYLSAVEFRKETKLIDEVISYWATWPQSFADVLDLYGKIGDDLRHSFKGSPDWVGSSDWDVSWGEACVFQAVPSQELHVNTDVVVTNTSTADIGRATLVAELSVGDDPVNARVVQTRSLGVLDFGPEETRTLPMSINVTKSEVGHFSDFYLELKLISTGGVYSSKKYSFVRSFDFVVGCEEPLRQRVVAGTDNTLLLLDTVIVSGQSVSGLYTPPGGIVRSSITLSSTHHDLLLTVSDASGNVTGWNPDFQVVDTGIISSKFIGSGFSTQVVRLDELASGPYTVEVRSLRSNPVKFTVSVMQEVVHPPILMNMPDTIELGVMKGDTSWLTATFFEVGGQQAIEGLEVHLSALTGANDTLGADSSNLSTLVSSVPPDSLVSVVVPIFSSTVEETGTYSGVLMVTSSAGFQSIPVHVNVIPQYLRGDLNFTWSVNVADLTALVDYLFKGGEEPYPLWAADLNCDTTTNIADLTYFVDYLFRGGPPPVEC